MNDNYLASVKKQFLYYKQLGDKTFAQLNDDALIWQFNEDSNSIAMIVSHISGNMRSRFTDFLDTDGEKAWRIRDEEFEPQETSREELLIKWEKGWECLFNAVNALTSADLERTIYIRNEGHTVVEAINRQLAHYPYHIGQIVMLGKMLAKDGWQSLSIPRGQSQNYNNEKFAQPKQNKHFTDDVLNNSTANQSSES
ncbi:DUF1572 family protein [Pedobacter sp.]|uniref:DUF1572 family protein n=1 Tax=Pedobacter sp. TaxID=1411316 RepID=UPI0031DCD195